MSRAPALALLLVALLPASGRAEDVRVTFELPGASAEEIETQVNFPVEEALARLPRLARLRSASLAGSSVVTATFDGDADLAAVREALAVVQRRLPPEAELPLVQLAPRPLRDAVRYTLESETVDLATLLEIHETAVRPRLLATAGVADVRTIGGVRREVWVEVDPDRLAVLGLDLGQVTGALRAGFVDLPAGRREDGAPAPRGIADDLGDRIVTVREGGAPVRLRDIATVALATAPDESFALRDGRPVVEGLVLQRTGAARDGDAVRKAIGEGAASLPEGVRIRPLAPRLHLRLTLPRGLTPEATRDAARAAVKAAHEVEAVVSVLGEVGGPDDELPRRPASEVDLLVDVRGDLEPAALAVLRGLRALPDVLAVRRLGVPGERRVLVRGPDLDGLDRAAGALLAALRVAPGVRACGREDPEPAPEKVVELDRERVAALGLRVADVRETIAVATGGLVVGRAREGARSLPVRVMLGAGRPSIRGPDGALVPLDAVASLREVRGPAAIRRVDSERVAAVWFEAEDVPAAVAAARKRLADAGLPAGVEVVWPAE